VWKVCLQEAGSSGGRKLEAGGRSGAGRVANDFGWAKGFGFADGGGEEENVWRDDVGLRCDMSLLLIFYTS